MKNKIILLFVIVALLFFLPSCRSYSQPEAAEQSAADAFNMVVLMPGEVPYFSATCKGMDDAAEKLGVKLEYEYADWNSSTQNLQAGKYYDGSVDMIILCAADAEGATQIMDEAAEAEVPVLAFTNAIGNDDSHYYDGLVSYVGQNEVKTGMLLAEMAAELLDGENGKCVEILGVNGTFPQINRQKGFREGIDGLNIEVVGSNTSNWKEKEAYDYIRQLVHSGTEFNIVVCQDDNSAIGAGKALLENNLKNEVRVVGMGGSIEGLQALKDGLIDGTIYMSAIEEGYAAIETAVKYLNNETTDKVINIQQFKVDRNNVDSFVGEW